MLVGGFLVVIVLALVLLSRQVRALVAVVVSQRRTIAAQCEALMSLEAKLEAVDLLAKKIAALNFAVSLLAKKIDTLSMPAPPADADGDEEAATQVIERSTMLSIAPPRKKP